MNSSKHPKHPLLTAPNLLTCIRFVCAPVLLWLAWNGHGVAFLVLLAGAFLTDVLDGLVAKLTGQITQLGAMLDSWADVILYCTIALSCWWLWPDIVAREAVYVGMVVASSLLPAAVSLIKFGAFASYHTWTVKLAAACMGLTLYVLFLGGPAWPFRAASFLCVIAAAEEIGISLISSELRSNVRSIWDVMRANARDLESKR